MEATVQTVPVRDFEVHVVRIGGGSPLVAFGFAALLIGSLGTLAFANVRRR